MRFALASLLVLLLLAIVTHARPAAACATCGCGDPTLTALGTERPFRGRLRLSLDTRHRTDAIGQERVDRIAIDETRVDAALAWAPRDDLFVLATVPVLRRSIAYVNEARATTVSLGDVELRAKLFVAHDRPFMPRHSYSVLAGLAVPTAPRRADERGVSLPNEAQPGTGSFGPSLGLAYTFTSSPWALFASAQGSVPLRGTGDYRASPSVRTTVALQRRIVPALAARLGLDGRIDARAYEGGRPERDSGGLVVYASPEILVTPFVDVLFVLSVRVPALQALAGSHREGTIFGAAVAVDL